MGVQAHVLKDPFSEWVDAGSDLQIATGIVEITDGPIVVGRVAVILERDASSEKFLRMRLGAGPANDWGVGSQEMIFESPVAMALLALLGGRPLSSDRAGRQIDLAGISLTVFAQSQ